MCGFCDVWVCVCAGFVMYGCVCVCGFCNVCVCVCVCVNFLMCGFSGNCVGVLVTCVLVFTVVCIFCAVFFVLFRLCIFILTCFVCTGVRTSGTD